MNIDAGLFKSPSNLEIGFDEESSTVKSSLRMRYDAETKVFRDQHGSLENIRQKLGFSRRKMCQLLLVDPSAWTRWMKDESKIPPHIYRSMEWFLALNQKALTHPELSSVFLSRFKAMPPQILEQDVLGLRKELARQKLILSYLMAAILVIALTGAGWFWAGI